MCRRSAPLLAVLLACAGCAAARPEAVDAVTGLPLRAQVRELGNGRLMVSADGYETWSGPAPPGGQVALHPLWRARFLGEAIPDPRPPPPPSACCPGTAAR